MKRYTFAKCQTHPRCPDVVGWWLIVQPGDFELEMDLHRSVISAAFLRDMKDPHKYSEADSVVYEMTKPLRLGAGWLNTKWRLPGTVLVNSAGGICPMNDSITVLKTIERDEMIFPGEYDALRCDERITIKRWEGAKHYYLNSNKNRIFVPNKFNTYTEAEEVAMCFVPGDRIIEELPQRGSRRDGD